MPRAVVIPHFQWDEVWSIKFRLPKPFRGGKYYSVAGGRYDLYGLDYAQGGRDLFLCEGEFDCMLLHQHIGDVADVLTLGAASIKDLELDLIGLFNMGATRLFLALDHDENGTGDRAAAELATKLAFFRPHRVNPPDDAKDITDAWAAGADLRAWALNIMGLNKSCATPEQDYYTIAWPADSPAPVIAGKWYRNEAGEVVASYTKGEAQMCMEMMR